MGLLIRAALAALVLAGCYEPAIRDCTISCASPGDCATGQVCGSDGLCAAPEIAGQCRRAGVDAGPHDDARVSGGPPRDADPPDAPDAPATVALHVQIMGTGAVLVDGVGTCSSKDAKHGDCVFDVAAGAALIAHAVQLAPDEVFTRWTSTTCADQGVRCAFTATAATALVARFGRSGMHGDGLE